MAILSSQIANLRVDYTLRSFDEKDLFDDPLKQFEQWMEEAIKAEVNEPNAMTLATVKEDGSPAARVVLLKGFDERGFTFFTNYDSAKGNQLSSNNHVAIVFCWLELQRQVRIEGVAEKISEAESDAYFMSRPNGSRIGAHASPQSSIIGNRKVLEDKYAHFEKLFQTEPIIRPVNWGGYLVKPSSIEFWQGRKSRLHDRFLFKRSKTSWEINRLAP